MDELLKIDSSFNEEMFITKVNNIFIKLMNAIMFKDLDSVKHFLNDELEAKYKVVIDDLKSRGLTEVYDELNVKNTFIRDVHINDEYIVIDVDLISRYMDYFIDSDGNYVSGINDHRIEKLNRLTFMKKIDGRNAGIVRKCPACGSSIDVNNNGKILGYIREMSNGTYDFKCFNHYNLPFVLRFLNGETPTDNDTVFEYEGNLSKLIKIPTLELI